MKRYVVCSVMLLAAALADPASAARPAASLGPMAATALSAQPVGDARAANATTAAGSNRSLREGVVAELERTDLQRGVRLKINGSWLLVAEGTTRVFRRGMEVGQRTLDVGQKVKFTLAPVVGSVGSVDTLGVVYVQ